VLAGIARASRSKARRVGDLISYKNDGKGRVLIADKIKGA
jgi:hypothetical protein